MLKVQKKPVLNAVALTIVAVVFLVAGLALAQGPGQKAGGRNGKLGMCGPGQGTYLEENGECNNFTRFDRMTVRLELTEEQKAVIEKLHEDNRAENLALRKDMMRLRNELQGEMMKDEPSEKTALSLSAQMNDIKGEQKANRLKTRLAVRKQLTPEQRDMMLMIGGQGQGQGMGKGQRGGSHGQKGHHGKAGMGCRPGGGGSQGNCR